MARVKSFATRALSCLFVLALFQAYITAQITINDTTNYVSPPKQWEVCRQDTFLLDVFLPGTTAINDSVAIYLTLPSGLVGGSFQSVSSGTLSAFGAGTSSPHFKILAPANGSQVIRLMYTVKAGCDLFDTNAVNPFLVQAYHYSGATGILLSTANTSSQPMAVSGGQFLLSNVFHKDYTMAQLGVPFVRRFTYVNTGNLPFSGSFEFTDTIEFNMPAAAVEFEGIAMAYLSAGSIVSTVNTDSIVSVKINFTNLMPNDSVVIADTLLLFDCPSVSLNNTITQFTATYGCPSEPMCQVLHRPTIDYTSSSFDPNDKPEMDFVNMNIGLLCPANPDMRKYAFINDSPWGSATGAASGLWMAINRFSWVSPGNNISYVDTSTVHVYKMVSGSPVTIPHTYGYTIPNPTSVTAPHPFYFEFSINEIVPHGDTIFLEFTESKICVDSVDYQDYFNKPLYMDLLDVNARYEHPCTPSNTYGMDYSKGPWGEAKQMFKLSQFFNNLTGTVVDSQEVWMDANSTSKLAIGEQHPWFLEETYIDTTVFEIEVELQLDSGLALIADSIYFKGLNLNAPDLYPISVNVMEGDGVNRGTNDIVRARFRIPGNYFQSNIGGAHYNYGAYLKYSALYDSLFNNFAVSFKLQALCIYSPPGGIAHIKENFFLIYDKTCSPECKFPIASVGDRVSINCPGCYLPGWNLSAFSAKRKNLGLADVNNNNYPDVTPMSSSPIAGPEAHEERIMKNDTIQCFIKANTSDGMNLLFSNIGFDYDYGQFSLQGGLMQHLEFLGGTGIYRIMGSPVSFTIPAAAGNIDGGGNFYMMLDKTDWFAYGLDTTTFFTKYGIGHDVEFNLEFRVKDNLNTGSGADPYFSLEGMNGFMYMSGTDFANVSGGGKTDALNIPQPDIENPVLWPPAARADLLYWCTGWEGRIITVGVDFASALVSRNFWGRIGYGPEVDPCLKIFESTSECSTGQTAAGMSDINQNALNAFSFELRNLWQLDSIDFTIPPAYEIERFELRYQVMTPNSGGTATILPCDETDITYSPYIMGPSDTTWVNDTTVRIYPWNQIQNVTGFSNCATNTSFYDESKVIRIYPVLRMKDCGTTPLQYPFTNYPVRSYWSEFPLSSTNDTTITRYVSGNFTRPYLDWQVQVLNVSNSTPGSDLAWTVNVGPGPNATEYAGGTSVGVNNGFFWIGPANGNTTNIDVQWGSSVTSAPIVGTHNGLPIYGLGKIGSGVYNASFGGQTGPVSITADYSCAGLDGPDSLMLIFGDNCYSYPDTLVPGEVCFMDTIYLPIPYETPLLQYDDDFPAVLLSCDTTGFSIEFNVVNEGNIGNLEITMTTGSPGIQYVPGTGTLYLNSTSTQEDPVANTFTFDNLSGFNALNGSAVFEFDMATWCNYDGSPINFEITATNYCGDTLSPILFTYSPVSVTQNVQTDTLSIIAYSADTINGCRDSSLISITLLNSGTQASSLNDTLVFQVPAGIDYLSGYPYTSIVGTDISFAVPNIPAGDSVTISFWVDGNDYGCGSPEIPVTLYGNAENRCDTVICSSSYEEITTATTTITIIKGDPQFTSLNLGSFCEGDSISVTIQNMANVSAGNIRVRYYCISNETGPIAPCFLGTSTTTGLGASATITFTNAITPICSNCNEVMVVMESPTRPCFCEYDTITGTINCDTIIDPPCEFVVDAGNDTAICQGECVTLNGIPGTPYPIISWSPTLGLSDPTIANPLACPPYPITYVMTVTDSVTGCEHSDSVEVYVNKKPKVGTNLNMVLCTTSPPFLVAAYNHTTGLMSSPYFTPSPSGNTVITGPLTVITIPSFPTYDFYAFNPALAGPGVYTIMYTVTDTATGCIGYAGGTITVVPAPSVTITGDTILCKGESTVLTANPTGVGPFTYLWSTGATTPSITTATAGTYTVTVTSPGGCTASATTTVIYAPSSPINIFNTAGSPVICAGTSFFLFATPGYSGYQWYNAANPSVILSTSMIFVPSVSGTYCVKAYNAYGCETKTKCITITITPAPDVVATPAFMTICVNAAPFALGFHIGSGGPTYTGYFSPSGGHITSSSPGFYHTLIFSSIYVDNFSPALAGVGTHLINYSYTDSNGCTGTATMTIQVVGPPVISFPAIPDIDLCTWDGNPVPIAVSTSGGICTLSGPGVDPVTNTFDPIAAGGPGTYVLSFTCSNKCGSTTREQTVTVTEHSLWHQTTENSNGGDVYNDVITDAQGSVYVVGYFIDETTLNGGGNPDITINNGGTGQEASFLAKYDKCANLIWVAHATDGKSNIGNSITLDEINNLVYITGNYSAKVQFNSSLSSASLCTSGYSQVITGPKQGAYIAQYDMTTGCLYFAEDASVNTYTDSRAITVNESNGNIFIGGRTGISMSSSFTFMRKFVPTTIGIGSSHGAPIWTVSTSGGRSMANDMDFDELNNRLWTIGSFERSITFTPSGASRSTNPTAGITDAFLVAFTDMGSSASPAGLRKGNIPTTGSNYMRGEGVAVDKLTGYPCITGTYTGKVSIPFEMNLGGGSINSITNNTTPNAYMICIDLSNLNAWARVADAGNGEANGLGVAINSPYAYFTGNFNKHLTIDLMPFNPYMFVGLPGMLKLRTYAASYLIANGNGSWANVTESPSSGGHTPNSITTDLTSNLFIVGAYDGEMSYYSGTPASGNLNSTGTGSNGFILRGYLPNGDFKVIQTDSSGIVFETPAKTSFSLRALPNPTTGVVELVAEGFPEGADATIEIHSITGLSLFKGKLTSNRYRLDISHLSAGTYLLTVIYNQQPVTIRVIKI